MIWEEDFALGWLDRPNHLFLISFLFLQRWKSLILIISFIGVIFGFINILTYWKGSIQSFLFHHHILHACRESKHFIPLLFVHLLTSLTSTTTLQKQVFVFNISQVPKQLVFSISGTHHLYGIDILLNVVMISSGLILRIIALGQCVSPLFVVTRALGLVHSLKLVFMIECILHLLHEVLWKFVRLDVSQIIIDLLKEITKLVHLILILEFLLGNISLRRNDSIVVWWFTSLSISTWLILLILETAA